MKPRSSGCYSYDAGVRPARCRSEVTEISFLCDPHYHLPNNAGPAVRGSVPRASGLVQRSKPGSFDPVGQQGSLQRTHHGHIPFRLQPYVGIPAERAAKVEYVEWIILVARAEKFTEVAHLVQPLLGTKPHSGFHQPDPKPGSSVAPSGAASKMPVAQGCGVDLESRCRTAMWHSGRKSQRRPSAILPASDHSSFSPRR